jgi:hypothetical protein
LDVAEDPDVKVTVEGVHDEVRPVDGATDVDRLRDPWNPFRLVTVTVDVPDEPDGKVTVNGFAAILNPDGAITLTLMTTEWDSAPLVPVTVTV